MKPSSPSNLPPDLIRAAERKALALLARSDLRPGVAPSLVAKANGYLVRYSRALGGRVHGRYNKKTCTISVALGISATRREFSISHELMEANVPLGIPAELKEAWCDRGAAALMMPARAFIESGSSCGWDLEALRAWWPSCSWNALVRRIADLVPGTAAAAWHRQQLRFRQTHPEVELPEHADQLEEFVACEALHGSGRSELRLGGLELKAWKSGPGRAVTVVRKVG